MKQPRAFAVESAGEEIRTRGLRTFGTPEIHLSRPTPELEGSGFELLRTLGDYIVSHQKALGANDKVSHGYWLVQLRRREDGDFEVFESTADGGDFIRGGSLALHYWKEQSDVCRRFDAEFSPPRPDQKAAVSLGVLEGDIPVWGVRYPAPPHMSGWYLTTERFSGNVADLRVEHLYHVTAERADLAPFLALPPGFRFEVTKEGGTAAFDEPSLKDG